MRVLRPFAVAALFTLLAAAPALGDPPLAPPAAEEDARAETEATDVATRGTAERGLAARDGAGAAPSAGAAAARLLGAFGVVGALLALTLVVLRFVFLRGGRAAAIRRRARSPWSGRARRGWLAFWPAAREAEPDPLEILSRSHVGPKESICLVRAGHEQFLIGVTTERISLLGRLGAGPAPATEPDRAPLALAAPAPASAEEPDAADFAQVAEAAVQPTAADASFHALLARSRERLSRLALDAHPAGARSE